MRSVKSVVLAAVLIATAVGVQASEVGHFSPAVANIRDYFVPPTGIYAVAYNSWYMSNRLNDESGNEIDQITIGAPPLSTTLNLDIDLNLYALSPGVMWSTKWKILGARYGAYALIPFSNTSLGASLTTVTGTGRSAKTSEFNIADCFVQPVWLGWSIPHWDVTVGYGFYAPIGKYGTEQLTLPVIGEVTVEKPDNIGLGFWTNQFQGAGAYFPWPDKRMAITGVMTYEIHGKKKDFDLTPGQNLTINWGISQYLPLNKDKSMILDVGPAGYDSWQISDDSGMDAVNPSVHDSVHGVGVQAGTLYAPLHSFLTFRYLYEFSAKDRFRGQWFGVNLAVSF